MLLRQASWLILAGAVGFVVLADASGQGTPKVPITSTSTTPTASAQIIPVSLTNEHIAASVNGEKILVGEIRKVLDQRPYPVSLTEEQKKQLRHTALEVLVDDTLMRQYFSKYGPKITQTELNTEVTELDAALKKRGQTREMFMKESGQTSEQLSRDIVARLQWKGLLLQFLPDDKARTYYESNRVFFDKVFVRASHILIKLPATPSKEQRDQAVQQMLVWRQDILTGKVKFEDVAKQHSQCPTKDKGGDIGQFPYKFVVVPEFAKAAFSMKEGEISDVIQSVFGLHLIKTTERTKGDTSTFEALKETVREVYAQDEDLYNRILADQRKKGEIKIQIP